MTVSKNKPVAETYLVTGGYLISCLYRNDFSSFSSWRWGFKFSCKCGHPRRPAVGYLRDNNWRMEYCCSYCTGCPIFAEELKCKLIRKVSELELLGVSMTDFQDVPIFTQGEP